MRSRAGGANQASTKARRSGSSVAAARSTAGARSAALMAANAGAGGSARRSASARASPRTSPVADGVHQPAGPSLGRRVQSSAVEHLGQRPRRQGVPCDLERRGREWQPEPDLVEPDLERARRRDAGVTGQCQDAAARHRVAVDRRDDRAREAEDLEHHAVEVPHEGVELRRVELVQGDEVQARREEPVVARQDDRARVPPGGLRERVADRPQAPRVQRVALAAGEGDLDGVRPCNLDNPRQVVAGGSRDRLSQNVEIARPDPYLKIEKLISFSVRNSSRTGIPSRVFAIPRRMAGMISSGRLTRSP